MRQGAHRKTVSLPQPPKMSTVWGQEHRGGPCLAPGHSYLGWWVAARLSTPVQSRIWFQGLVHCWSINQFNRHWAQAQRTGPS